MNSKSKMLMVGIASLLAVSGFAMSTNYSNRDGVVSDFKSTTDGSFFTKHLVVQDTVGEVSEEKKDNSVSKAELKATPGFMQGLWSKADGTNVTPEEFNEHAKQVYGAYFDNYAQFLGVDMTGGWTNPVVCQYDQWKGVFGDDIGLIHYHQNPSAVGAWASFNQNITVGGNATIGGSGCGPTGYSAIFSTMLHKYITPLECVIARDTMYLRLGQGAGYMHGITGSAGSGAWNQNSEKMCEFVSNLKYNGQSVLECTKENLVQSRVDETLAKSGMVLLVPHGLGSSTGIGTAIGEYWTGKGHYIAIRAKDDAGNYYTVDGSHDSPSRPQGNHDVPHPWSDLQGCGFTPNAVHYVTPGPGYDAYIQSLKSSGSSSSTAGGGNISTSQSTDTQSILDMSESEFFSTISEGRYSSYGEASAAWRANENAERSFWESQVVDITVPVWKWTDDTKTNKVASTTTITVNKHVTSLFKDFMTDLHNLPEKYVILSVGGFSPRLKNNGSSNPGLSAHTFGTTLDINAYAARGMGSLGAPENYGDRINKPVEHQSSLNEVEKSECCTLDSSWYELAVKYQLNWGGNWSDDYKDPMHFSVVGDGSEKGQFVTQKKGVLWQ